MPASPLTVTLPEPLLKQIRGRARRAKRTVEAEVIQLLSDAVATGDHGSANGVPATKPRGKPARRGIEVSDDEALPPDIAEALARIERLGIRGLRKAVKPIMKREQSDRLADLNRKAQDEGLSDAEERERDELLHLYEKSMVVRSAALAELHERGEDISKLIAP